jgi:hypothetical protein
MIFVKKITFFSLFVAQSLNGNSQIDYSVHPETIGSGNKIVRVDWLKSTPRNCQIDFNHLVNFINVKNDQTFNSKVIVELYHNDRLIRSFIFPTGDQIVNRIYVGEAIKLRKTDKVYFIFRLATSTTHYEEYVFNIYEDPRAAIKTVTVVKTKVVSENVPKARIAKPKKHSIGWIGRNIFHIQEPIGKEY